MMTTLRLAVAAMMAAACSAASTGGGDGEGGSAGNGGSNGGQGGSAQGGSAQGGTGATGTGGGLGAFGGTGGSGAGSGGSVQDGGCVAVEQTATNTVAPIDIIWAIDNSGSMTTEAGQVQNNMNLFASYIINQGIDFRVVVISSEGPPGLISGRSGVCIPAPLGSGSCPNDSNPPRYVRIDDEVGSTNALEKFLQHYPTYKQYLRQNSLKHFAVVTDDDSTMNATTFIDRVNALDPGWFNSWRFHGVWCWGACAANPLGLVCANEGTVYDALMATPYAGTRGDMCAGQQGFAPLFTALAQTIAAGTELSCDWAIPPPPSGEQLDPNKVNVSYTSDPSNPASGEDFFQAPTLGDCGTHNNAWYYDNPSNPTRVIACPDTCVRIKNNLAGRVNVAFGCATEMVPT